MAVGLEALERLEAHVRRQLLLRLQISPEANLRPVLREGCVLLLLLPLLLDLAAALPCSKLRLKTAEADLVVFVVKQCAE